MKQWDDKKSTQNVANASDILNNKTLNTQTRRT